MYIFTPFRKKKEKKKKRKKEKPVVNPITAKTERTETSLPDGKQLSGDASAFYSAVDQQPNGNETSGCFQRSCTSV